LENFKWLKNVDKCAVDINSMFDFLRNINECSDSHTGDVNLLSSSVENHDCNEFLNVKISEEEIIAATKQLKNNKAARFDHVLNEHISSTLSIFLPLYTKLF
jgi:hypothetical protein